MLIGESLAEHSWVIRDCDTPAKAFKAMFDLHSHATGNDAVRLETRWVNEVPVGDGFMEYIATMSMLKDQLGRIGVARTEKNLCLRMMTPLSTYPDDHPFREAWKWLNNKFQGEPDKMTLDYFRRRIQSATDKISNDKTVTRVTTMSKTDTRDADYHALTALTKSFTELAMAMQANMKPANQKYTGSSKNRSAYSRCRFCKSSEHEIEDCDDPAFDITIYRKNRGNFDRTNSDHGRNKGRSNVGAGKRFGGREKANHVDDGSNANVQGRDDSDNVMNKTCDCYEQIGKPPSSGIDPDVACEGGGYLYPSLAPLVCPLPKTENKITDVTDVSTDNIFESESISESLYHTTMSTLETETRPTIIDSGSTRTMWADGDMFIGAQN